MSDNHARFNLANAARMFHKKYPYQMTPAEREAEEAQRVARLGVLRVWRERAIADGWLHAPTYDTESELTACTLTHPTRHYKVSLLLRPPDPPRQPMTCATINAWDADGIALDHAINPERYDMAALIAGERSCPACGAKDVETVRIAFANRACRACAFELRKQLERPGWCD